MSAQPSRRFSKWWILLGFMLLSGTAAWGLAQHPWVRAQIDLQLAETIQRELGLDATIGPVRVAFPLRLVADRIEFRHPTEGLLASAERLEVTPSLLALARGKLALKRVLIEGAKVRLRIEDGRIVNLPELPAAARQKPKTGAKPKAVKFPLEELVVRRASLEVDASPRFSASLSDVMIHVRVSRGSKFSLALRTGSGEFSHPRGLEMVRSFGVSASMEDGTVQLEHLALRSTLLTMHLSKASFAWPFSVDQAYEGRVAVEGDLGKLAALPHGLALPPMRGKLAVRGKVSGKGRAYLAQGEVQGEPWLAGFGFGHLELKLEATQDEVRLLPGSLGRVDMNGGEVGLEGRLGLGPGLPLEVSADVKRLDFHKLMAQLEVTQNCLVNWVLRGGFKLEGTIDPVAISGPIWADHLSFKALTSAYHDPAAKEVIGTPPGRVAGRVVIRPDALRFENLHGRLPHSDMMVTVHVGFDEKLGVSAHSTNLDLRDATSLMGMAIGGHGSFDLEVGGTYSKATLTGSVDLTDFALDGYRIGNMKTRASLEKGGLAVRFVDTDIRKPDSHYRIQDMLLDFTQAFAIEAKGQLDRLALADFYHTFLLDDDPDFKPYQGHVHGTASVHYTLGFPGDLPSGTLVVDTDLDVLDAQVYGVRFGRGHAEGSWTWSDIKAGTRGARLALSELHLTKGGGTVTARGAMELDGKLALTAFAEEMELAEIEPLRALGLDIKGEVGAVGTVRGTLWTPEVALDVQSVGAQVAGRALGDGNLRFFVTHRDDPWVQRARGPLAAAEPCKASRAALAQADWDGGRTADDRPLAPRAYLICGSVLQDRTRLDVALGIADGIPARGRVDFAGLAPTLIWPQKRASDVPLAGTLAGNLELRGGTIERPDSLVGGLVVSTLTLGQEGVTLTSDGPIRVALTGQGASIERAHFVGSGTQIDVSGGATFEQGLATSLQGKLDLKVLPVFVPSLAGSSGLLEVSVNLTGKPSEPQVFGRATLSQGSVLLSGLGQALDKVDARISFSERELLLEQMSANFAGGQVQAHGSAALEHRGLGRYELFINARDVNYSPMGGVELSFAADTKLAYDAGRRVPELTGTVRILRMRYKRAFSLGLTDRLSGLSQAKRVTRASYDPAKDRIAFDLRVIDEAPLRIDNNLLKADLKIEDSESPFRIVGTDQRVGVLGTLEVTRGTVFFRNTRFNLEEGAITFIDEHRVRPRLDIHARTEFRRQADASGARWWISLRASGETDDLKLETSSEPALAQEDIALLLTVGLTRAEAERLGTTTLTQGAALEALATVTGVDKEVRKALPVVDDFAVTSAYSARTNRTEPQVVVGKRISDRVRASATTGLTTDSNFKTGVEWRLDDQTSVEAGYDNVQTTTSSQFGNVGLDLRWRLEFD